MAGGPVEPRREGRYADRALVLTVATLILLTPPILSIFDVPVTILGVPLLHVYSFAVWLAAIGCGFLLARQNGYDKASAVDDGSPPGERTNRV